MKDSPLKTPGRCSFRITLSSTFFAPRGFKLSKGSPEHVQLFKVWFLLAIFHDLEGKLIAFIHLQINGTFQEPLLGGSCTVPSLKIHRGMT
jgi:hypothetical protein